ncbi:MAG TPA: alpha/beta fold hydrolase, partial [Polyangiaceae bacterium]|nr:alpha/beta fold hydrolase [Polyangiaceae bacterium]
MRHVTPALGVLILAVVAPLACGGEPPPPVAPVTSATAAASATPPAAKPPREDATLTPREVFFGNPDRTRVRISPDGSKLAFLANEGGVLNVFVAPADDPSKAKPLTHETKRNLRTYDWSMDAKYILWKQDKDGDENWRLHASDVASGQDREIVAADGAQAQLAGLSPKKPGQILALLNDRDKRYHDLYVVDLKTGKRTMLQKNVAGEKGDSGFEQFVTDDDFKVRFGLLPRADGGVDVQQPGPPKAKGGDTTWTTYMAIPMEDHVTTQLVDFDKAGGTLYMLDSRGRDTAALVTVDLKTKKSTVVLDDGQADLEYLLVHPTEKRLQAAEAQYDRTRWHVIDRALLPDFDFLRTVAEGDMAIASRTLDDKRWIVAYGTEGATRYYRYDREAKPSPKTGGAPGKATFLFVSHDALDKVKLGKMLPRVIKSRDGLDLVSYLTLPPASDPDGDGVPSKPLPTVLLVHGGPWARDSWGLNPMTQWLASRGYAVLSVNYRGSTGFGKTFVNAGNHEWAAKMHDDLVDAVEWAKTQKIADPSRVAIMGGSYGGYATL